MATSGFLKVDKSSLKTVAMKETPFNASGFPTKARDAYKYIANPNTQEEVSVVKPQLNSTIGVKLGSETNTGHASASWGGFIERPTNKRGYYFPLDSNLSGYDLQDMIGDSYEDKITAYLKNHPEVVPEGYKPSSISGRDIATVCSNLWDEKVENGSYSSTGSKDSTPNSYRCKNLIPVTPNTEYTFVAPAGNWYINYYDARGSWFFNGGLKVGTFQFTASSATHFISFWRYNAGGASSYTHDVAVVEGPNGVYEPYYEGVRISNLADVTMESDVPSKPPITITLPSIGDDLHGLPSAKDKVEFVNRVYENMKSIDLGSLEWTREASGDHYIFTSRIPEKVAGLDNMLSSVYGVVNVASGSDVPNMCMRGHASGTVVIIRNDSKTSAPSLSDNWLSGVIIHYETASGGQRYKARVMEKKSGSRAYQQGDENNLSYITDMTTTIYPLSTPKLLDVTELAPMKPVKERIPNIVGSFSTGYENGGLCTYEGAFPSRTNIVNLIDNSTVKNNWVNAVVSVMNHTPINARDGISILPSNMSNDTRRTFSFTPTTTGKYHFSFYARLSGDARSYSSSSLRGISLTISPNPTASYDIAAPRLIRGSNIYNLEYEWNRYGRCISLNANTTYTITLNWYASNNWRRSDTPLKICGVLLESSSFLSPYDVKGTDINGSGRSINGVVRPLLFDLARLDGALRDPTKSWMVTYLRKINTTSQARGPYIHADNFGLRNYGYGENSILGGTSADGHASDYYNCWEKVIFYHKANEAEFKYEVFNTETNKHYSLIKPDSSIIHQTIGNVQYNLCLGTLVTSSSLQDSDNAQYRDLLYVPNVTEEEYQAEINKFFEVGKVHMTYEKTGEDPITVTDAVAIKKTNLLEGSTLEY